MLRRLLARFTHRGVPSDEEIARELRDHLELDAASRASSTSDARRRFGNVTSAYEATRDVWRWAPLEQLEQDVRHGVRALRRAPLYAVAVAATLGIGIGATAAVYSLSRSIHNPFPRLPQDELLWIMPSNAACGVDCVEVSPAGFLAVQARAPSLRPIAVSTWGTTLRSNAGSESLKGFRVSPTTFETIGAPFALGRGFPAGAGEPNGPRFLVLSYDFWHDRFGGSRGIIDSVVTIGGFPYTVTGVLDNGVVFPTIADVYAPLSLTAADATDYTSRYLYVFGRLGSATRASVVAEVRTIGEQLARESPRTDSGWVLRARPIADFHTDDVALIEQIAGLASLLVFLAACMSAANLSLSRLTTRRQELALRAALGVGRWRLARHLLTEALLLSVVASVIGVALAFWGVRAIRDAIPADFAAFVPGWARLGVDATTLLFALAVAVLAMLTFAALPVLRATRVDLAGVLSDGGRATTGGVRGTRSRATLIVLEVSIALVLLSAAMLFTQSVRNMLLGDAGVRLDHTLVMHLTLPASTTDSSAAAFYRGLDTRLAETPGIRAAGVTSTTPLSNNYQGVAFRLPGRTLGINGREPNAIDEHVTPNYFRAAGVRVEDGRGISSDDDLRPNAARVAVINRFMADALWPHESAIGRVVIMHDVQYTVVGVASNVHHGGLDEPLRYTIYRSIAQAPATYGDIAVWTDGDPDGMRDAVRGVIARVDPNVAVGGMMTMVAMQARHVSAFSMIAGMLEVLAMVATTIATVGLYGLIAYSVAQRTREIGVRIALGAQRRDILSEIGAGAVRLTMIGVVFGVGGAVMFARLLTSLLYGVSASDPRTYVAVAAGLLCVALAAALVPSWRASRVDPTIALRD